MKEYAVCYMLGGISKRFDGRIKAFSRVGPDNETMIEYSMNQAISAGFNKFYLIINSLSENIIKRNLGEKYKGKSIDYFVQEFDQSKRDRPWGTGDSVGILFGKIDCPLVVCAGDNIYGENTFKILYEHLKVSEDDCVIGYKLIENVQNNGLVNRGLFEIDPDRYVKRIVETFGISRKDVLNGKYDQNTLSSSSIFVLNHRTLELLNEKLLRFKEEHIKDRLIEFILAESLDDLLREGLIKMKCYETPDKILGITNPGDEIKIREELMKIEDE